METSEVFRGNFIRPDGDNRRYLALEKLFASPPRSENKPKTHIKGVCMSYPNQSLTPKIDRKQVTSMTIFVMNNVPGVDEFTLKKFLELMNTMGSFGSITDQQLKQIMTLMMKYIPDTRQHSLQVLVEHLNICLPLNGRSSDKFSVILQNKSKSANGRQKRHTSTISGNRR